jgi:hypothetical protein
VPHCPPPLPNGHSCFQPHRGAMAWIRGYRSGRASEGKCGVRATCITETMPIRPGREVFGPVDRVRSRVVGRRPARDRAISAATGRGRDPQSDLSVLRRPEPAGVIRRTWNRSVATGAWTEPRAGSDGGRTHGGSHAGVESITVLPTPSRAMPQCGEAGESEEFVTKFCWRQHRYRGSVTADPAASPHAATLEAAARVRRRDRPLSPINGCLSCRQV